MRSTFAGFTTAQLALRAGQQGLNVTGQNISNINTSGYTRQALDQISLNFTNGGRYGTSTNIGHGVMVKNITQIRDPFLDIRFRTEIAQVGEADVKLSSLKELESIFDEVIFIKNGEIVLHDEAEHLRLENGKSIDELFREVFRC
mgnify:CR=1 FL=1